MKRDASLTELSRDHHQALYRAMRMKRASDDDRAEVRDDVLSFWREHGRKHFQVEEEVLLPAYARYGDPGEEAVVRVLTDHVWVRERMDRLERNELDLGQLRELGQRLDDHVRHEERVLFPRIEEALGAEELAELGARIEAAEAEP
jgi:hemerythrin-like domain-containing protein